jgi:mannose-6-phosphate isomerase-like protein (cupin superfamily)
MTGYHADIEKKTLENEYFRKVLFTGPHSQLVLMTLKPEEEIGMETHAANDQFFRIEAGKGKAVMAGKEYPLNDGMSLVVPAGTKHNIINTSKTESLKLYTIYSPAHHPDGTVHKTKAEAEADEHKH